MTSILRRSVLATYICTLQLTASAADVSFDLSTTGDVLQPAHLAGTCLPIWNNATTNEKIKSGLALSNYRLFRFPNGSLSNGYHWNGTGTYTDDSIWVCDSVTFTAGFLSQTLFRGTSVNN